MISSTPKIFGIGLSKTGTTSLANALQLLGCSTKDNMGVVTYVAGDLSSIDLGTIDAFEALTDTPIPSFYRELDARYPGSKFILTVRDSDGWLTSCKKQFNPRFAQLQSDAHRRLFVDLYGTDVFDAESFANGYDRFVRGVREYFKNRTRDLLIIDVTAGEGWEKLCAFLGQPVPDIAFPKANVTQITWMSLDDLVVVARQGGRELMKHYGGERGVDLANNERAGNGSGNARALLARVREAVLGEDSLERTVRAANKSLVAGLKKLNPNMPVLSRVGDAAPYAERRHWNHLWLVDPLDGEGAFTRGGGDFSVNVALIEDGHPIYGVVYAPANDTVYYARAGKGAYRRVGEENPVPLATGGGGRVSAASGNQGAERGIKDPGIAPGSSCALSLCAQRGGASAPQHVSGRTMEWHTAAAHAVLRAAGLSVCDPKTGDELSYNKEELSNPAITIG